jgi:hypothetical protein
MDFFDVKNTFFAVCGARIMSVMLDFNDLLGQIIATIILAIVGATAGFLWKHYVLDRIKKGKKK